MDSLINVVKNKLSYIFKGKLKKEKQLEIYVDSKNRYWGLLDDIDDIIKIPNIKKFKNAEMIHVTLSNLIKQGYDCFIRPMENDLVTFISKSSDMRLVTKMNIYDFSYNYWKYNNWK